MATSKRHQDHVDLPRDVQRIRQRLLEQRGRWHDIAVAADVSHSWCSQFARNKIPNPGVLTLQKLWAAMSTPSTTAEAAK